jgi:hypothetical protein
MFRKLISISKGVPTVEQWAQKASKLVPDTPDKIMAVAIAADIANRPDNWKQTGPWKTHYSRYASDGKVSGLENLSKNVTVTFGVRRFKAGALRESFTPYGRENQFRIDLKGTTVNGLPVDAEAAKIIYDAWVKIGAKMRRVKESQAKALTTMKKNEAAWDMVEKLLGMKRNEFGALVPINTVSEQPCCGCEDGHCECFTKEKHSDKQKEIVGGGGTSANLGPAFA